MDTSSIILLVVSASISFGLGRLFVYLRNRKRQAEKVLAQQRAAQVLRDLPPGPESKKKSKRKRKRQQQQQQQQLAQRVRD